MFNFLRIRYPQPDSQEADQREPQREDEDAAARRIRHAENLRLIQYEEELERDFEEEPQRPRRISFF